MHKVSIKQGYEAVQQFMFDSDIIARQVVWQHHEKQDATGDPRRLRGDNQFLARRWMPKERAPFEIDASVERDVELAMASYTNFVAAC